MIITRVLDAPARAGQENIRHFASSAGAALKGVSGRQWIKLAAVVLALAGLTLGFNRLAHLAVAHLPMGAGGAGILCLAVFVVFLAANASVLVPMPITMPIIIAAAMQGNPLLVGLAAGAGSAVGECSGYIMGRLGHKVLAPENLLSRLNGRFTQSSLEREVRKHGPLAIGILAVQPILPFDIAGLIAGSLKMKFHAFFLAVASGRAVKYVLIAYMAGMLSSLPFFS